MTRDVIVVGAGPVGLFLAAELRLAGLEPLVLERETEPDPARDNDERGLTTRTLQTLAIRGLAGRATESSEAALRRLAEHVDEPADDLAAVLEKQPRGTVLGEFAMIPLVSRTPTLNDLAPPTMVIQGDFERVLTERASEQGVEIQRGAEVVGLTVDEGVAIELADGRRLSARYVVGCDGSNSIVRERAGFDVVRTDPSMVARIAVVHPDEPDDLPYGFARTPAGMMILAPAPAQSMTIEFTTDPSDFQASVERICGRPAMIHEVTEVLELTDETLQPTSYRRGRVLLAGDAAHVHSAIGGHGLNLGLQDAANLGWKLGLVANGKAPDELLDTYTTERHPVADQALRNSRAQVALLRTDPQTEALREIFAELVNSPAAVRRHHQQAHGLDIHYDTGPNAHVLAGTFFSASLNLANGKGLLLDYAGVSDVAAPWADRVQVITGYRPKTMTLLVRPDGYIAWAADQADPEADPHGLRQALTTWFGPG